MNDHASNAQVTLYIHFHLAEQSQAVLQNVQLCRGLCKSQLQGMATEQDLQYVCLALIATRLRVQELKTAGGAMVQVSPGPLLHTWCPFVCIDLSLKDARNECES